MTGEKITSDIVNSILDPLRSAAVKIRNFSLSEFEVSLVGRPGVKISDDGARWLDLSIITVSIGLALFGTGGLPSGVFPMLEYADSFDTGIVPTLIYCLVCGALLLLAWWATLVTILKLTPLRSVGTPLLGVGSAWVSFYLVHFVLEFMMIFADFDVIWANRVLVLVGQQMTEMMTQSPGSPQCLDLENCYGINQNFRLWWVLYVTFIIIGAAYGTNGDKPSKFLIPFTLIALFLILIAWLPNELNYHREVPMIRLSIATLLAYTSFGLSYYYCSVSEEYKANRLRSYVALGAVFAFFFAILIMNPPEFVKDLAASLGGEPAQERLDDIIAGTWTPSTLDKLAGDGIEASQWGGLFVNLIIATAGCVLGFGIGVVLAFGRQSDLPFFKVPSVLLIEIVRSGPLICWLYFAVFLLPDLMDPFYEAEDIIGMLIMFGFFGGCYIAEVLRGGLQAVDSGQKEAALALGLSPMQIRLQVELPNAVRTTLPSIVSVFIGLWKDTTLLFIVNILDFFKLSKDIPGGDMRFMSSFLEPVWVTAIVFWVFAFYLSRVSRRIERGLGLVREGGGEAA